MEKNDVPDAELEVLACLRQKGTATAAEIRKALHSFRPLSPASVATLLQRLEAKALVAREKGPVGKAFIYRTTQKSTSTFRGILERMVDRAFGGDSSAMVASLFETKPPTREELERVQDLLNQLRERKDEQK